MLTKTATKRVFQYVKTYRYGCAELNFSDYQNGLLIGKYTYQGVSYPIELPVHTDNKGNEFILLLGETIKA